MATMAKPWGNANTARLSAAKTTGPISDQRLLFAMWDTERAVRESASDNGELSENVLDLSKVVESLEVEVKELRDTMGTLRETMEKLAESIGDLLAAK